MLEFGQLVVIAAALQIPRDGDLVNVPNREIGVQGQFILQCAVRSVSCLQSDLKLAAQTDPLDQFKTILG